jgi:hypothetical protein
MVSIRRTATPPSFTPLKYGLLSVVEDATGDDLSDQHWRNGVQFQTQFCGPALSTASICVTGGADKPAIADGLITRGADPFAVFAWLNCSPIGYSPDEWRKLTVAALLNNESVAVEAVFATGVVAGGVVYPHLAANAAVSDGTTGQVVQLQTAATVVTGGASNDIVEAVGRLEGAMAGCYGGVPVLHVPRAALAPMAAWGLLEVDGEQLHTPGGSLIAAGAGYPGTAPDGTTPAAGTVWLYATGAVKLWRGPIETTGRNPAEWVGRARNDQVLVAERSYVLGWDCCHFATPVSLGGVVTGTAGAAT